MDTTKRVDFKGGAFIEGNANAQSTGSTDQTECGFFRALRKRHNYRLEYSGMGYDQWSPAKSRWSDLHKSCTSSPSVPPHRHEPKCPRCSTTNACSSRHRSTSIRYGTARELIIVLHVTIALEHASWSTCRHDRFEQKHACDNMLACCVVPFLHA
jgi:hypothetical protein